MKGKMKIYLLLAAFISIWGTIGIKIITTLNTKEPETAIIDIDTKFTPTNIQTVDTFSIKQIDRDPFLGTLASKKRNNIKPVVKRIKVVDTIYVPVKYYGVIAKQNSNDKVYVLTIEDQQYIMKPNQETKGVKLLKASKNEILVSYKGTKKTIAKL